MTAPLLEVRGLAKRFGTLAALDGVDLDVAPGTVHAVLGENGAGKSTLMNVLFGRLAPDAGTIRWRGMPVAKSSPAESLARGIAMVHQHFMLVDALTVRENVALADPRQAGFIVDARRAREAVERLAADHGLALDPDAICGDLPVGARQRVEIAKALTREVSLLILDEPTAVLAPREVRDLFATVRALAARGTAVLFISHKLDEVLELADHVTVLRRGRVAARTDRSGADAAGLTRAIVGADVVTGTVPARAPGPSRPAAVLAVEGLERRAAGGVALGPVSFTVHPGEIVGLAGVDGNGQDELVALLAGVARPDRGTIRLAGEDVTALAVAERWRRGFSVLPGDRSREGLVPDAPLWENLALREFDAPWARGRLGVVPARHVRRAADLLARFDVRAAGPGVAAATLSGGNQQKVLLARELARDPKVLVLANPTRGLDLGAAAALLRLLVARRDAGAAILLASTELEELLAVSDRVLVMHRGRLREATSLDREAVGALMIGAAA